MYGKLFATMYDGTLGTRGPWEALITFQQLIILADQDGVVDMTPEAISRRTTVPLEIVAKGLAALAQPDPDSRTPDEDGRRIVKLSDSRAWGWRIVNYAKYRAIRTAEERRAYMRKYQRERRARGAVNNVNRALTKSTNSRSRSKRKKHLQPPAYQPPSPEQDKGNVNGLSLSPSKAKGNVNGQSALQGETLDTWAEKHVPRSATDTEDSYRRRAMDAFVKFKASGSTA